MVRLRLCTLGVISAVLALGLAAAAGGTPSSTVSVTVTINGSGTIRASVAPRSIRCEETCHVTLRVRAGSRLVLAASASPGWKLLKWTGACQGVAARCTLRVTRAARLSVRFVPPGAKENPIPLGKTAALGSKGEWRMTVVSATPDATSQVLAAFPWKTVPPGAQYAMVRLALTYTGGGSATFSFSSVDTMGAHSAPYYAESYYCPQRFSSEDGIHLFSGQSASGNLCYLIASNDADTLMLYVGDYASKVWFALR